MTTTNYNIDLPAIAITETVGDLEIKLEFKSANDYRLYLMYKTQSEAGK